MLTDVFESAARIEALRDGPRGTLLDAFVQALIRAGYAPITVRRHLRAAEHFVHWAERTGVPVAGPLDPALERFRRHLQRPGRCPQFGHMNRTGFLGDLISWEDGVYGTSNLGRMGSMGRPSRFSPEMRERAIRLVLEQRPAHPSEWAALQAVATKLGTTAETLRKWVRQAERDTGQRPGLSTSERERLAALERENRELKRTNEILKTASAYFAQAALDRRSK